MIRRAIIIVLDSLGVGEMPDAAKYGDQGADTLGHILDHCPQLQIPNLQKMGMGNKQLYRKLKALTGQTPVEYIRDMRMQKAAKLLKAGKFSVSEVMYTVGFSNSSYFSKCFSKAFGMTPTEVMRS